MSTVWIGSEYALVIVFDACESVRHAKKVHGQPPRKRCTKSAFPNLRIMKRNCSCGWLKMTQISRPCRPAGEGVSCLLPETGKKYSKNIVFLLPQPKDSVKIGEYIQAFLSCKQFFFLLFSSPLLGGDRHRVLGHRTDLWPIFFILTCLVSFKSKYFQQNCAKLDLCYPEHLRIPLETRQTALTLPNVPKSWQQNGSKLLFFSYVEPGGPETPSLAGGHGPNPNLDFNLLVNVSRVLLRTLLGSTYC